ncbi:unnamed protein product [Penicillium nalgiovense]|uniref:protein geranylgeranyltransferase type II n=2 Tax=Penicillium nalgiovense TaxID=60175 RepID=A0A9W4HDB0_PENNA|nr:unnamed protein product [Penicillium nalgiovense]CAG7962996.1 unnamed protein product [Penicillium nalgiovense]CAG7977032.1 unnamed protein product [Penicillium nalgiovense]CAG8005503.1 unnamed protein product [Penicillium nalgiovense]CAG8014858.1 unnamed protein product [Penicillium nalgiovense]
MKDTGWMATNQHKRKDELEYWLTEHLRLNGVYWGLTALHILGHPDTLPRDQTIDFVLSCQSENGGFGAAPGHDAHMLYTVSAVQILVTIDAVDELDKRDRGGKEKVGSFIANLQNSDGSFMGDQWGETDTRFLYGALNALSLLRLMDLVDVPKAVSHIQSCENLDGAYGIRPGAESHAGQVFTCIGALAIAGRLDLVSKDRLGAWLSERQIESGGFNGRPEKLADACYSWWVGSSLAMIDRLHWIDGEKLAAFVLQCQDPDAGGFADRPGNMVDVYHTHFSLAGLSLLKFNGLEEIDAVYCMPKSITAKCLAGETITRPPCRLVYNALLFFFHRSFTSFFDTHFLGFDTLVVLPFPFASHSICYLLLPSACIMGTTLECIICPAQPQFSDVSHLLTHAASKAHLANHFKLKLRNDDPNSVELLKQYDEWFDTNGFAKLLSARMASKEIRKKRKDGASTSNTTKRTRSQASIVEPEGSSTPAMPATPNPDCLDPRLADAHNDDQQHAGTTLAPSTPNQLPLANSSAKSRTGPILRSMRSSNGTKSNVLQPVNASDLYDESQSLALPKTPTQRRHKPEPLERTWITNKDTPDPFIDSADQAQASGDAEMDKTRAEEIARLKGVLWPGMDIFDSATVQMRRRRNQKKDSGLLKIMEQTSLLVEPTEQVYSPHGTLLTEREITGNVEEYSPLKGETPIPKRGLTRTRSTRLTKADPNVPRAADRKRQKTNNDKDRENMAEEEAKEEHKSSRRSRRAAAHSYVGEDEEIGLTVNTFGKRPRGGFDVFVDQGKEEEDSKTSYQQPGFSTQFDTLTPTRLVLNGKTNTGINAPRIGHASLAKENIEPILNPQGRIGPHGWNSPFARRPDSDDFGFGPSCPPDLGDTYDIFDKAGYRSNPLQAPSNNPFYESQYEEEHTAAQNGCLPIDQIIPSEETIPEAEQIFHTYYFSTDAN